jgi:hypothetical protein
MHRTAMVYKLNIFGKVRGCFWAIALICIGCFLFSITSNRLSEVWFKLFSIAMVLFGIYLAIRAFCYRVILDAESVTVIEPFRPYSLKRIGVKGRRRFEHWTLQPFEMTFLEPKNPKEKRLIILDDVAFNKEWDDWFLHLPNLDNPQKPKIYFKKSGNHTQDRRHS